MQYLDITRNIHPEMAIYPKNPSVRFIQTQQALNGANSLTRIELGSHTGTHIDTPAHINNGGAGAFTYNLKLMNGRAEVIDLTYLKSIITAEDIPKTNSKIVLFKTRNSLDDVDKFNENFVALDDSAAEKCVALGFNLVGLDALSIRKRGTKNKVHELLINNDIIVLEGLWMPKIEPGYYDFMCLPLKVDLDGAPVRAVLKKFNDLSK